MLPPSAGGRLLVQVWVGPPYLQQASLVNDDSYVQMAPPSIISCTNLGSVGQVMSITGRNFGNVDDCTMKIAGYICPRPSLCEMHGRIACQILKGKGSKLAVQVCVAGQWSKVGGPATMFSYKGNVSFASRNPAHSLLIELTIFLKLTRSRLLIPDRSTSA